jgi:two-component system phosphate regulon response regulator PhoB
MTTQRILVVEDEAAIRQMIVFNLSRAGFEVDEAEDSATARVRIADARPDLVLIDWMLPDSSGLELTRMSRTAREFTDWQRVARKWTILFTAAWNARACWMK